MGLIYNHKQPLHHTFTATSSLHIQNILLKKNVRLWKESHDLLLSEKLLQKNVFEEGKIYVRLYEHMKLSIQFLRP